MPWKDTRIMHLREEFIQKAVKKLESISQLCREFNISRKTAHKWLKRYFNDGISGLLDRSKTPSHMPTKIRHHFADLVLSLRSQHPTWGAKKLRQVLLNNGYLDIPSISTLNRILLEENKISVAASESRQKFIRFEKGSPNELWQMDFKGHFRLPKGECHPLTILDDHSRYSLCLEACATENEQEVRKALEKAFHEYGLPMAMTMDNGSPWKGYPGQRLSRITVWMMRLGIKITHSRPNHPQTQGKDERFHRTLKEELLAYHNFTSLEEAQKHFDEWRELYNHVRPHEAIKMMCPAEKYRHSERKLTKKLAPIEYLPGDIVKKVGGNGEISFKGKTYYLGRHLDGEHIAIRRRNERQWDIFYVNSRLLGFEGKV